MMAAYGDTPVIRDCFDEASAALGEDLWQMVCEGPAERLALTVNTQPLMLTAGVAVYRAWCEAGGPQPAVVAGHSLGEYSALVAAGALAFADAVPLVRLRAAAMQEAVPQGEVVEAANLNAPGQIVIAGKSEAVARAIELARSRGAKRAVQLPVSAPFHCALMRPAAEKLEQRLQEIAVNRPDIPVLNNVDVRCEDEPERIRDALVRQAYSPVRWIETVEAIAAKGISQVYECGPGKVLAGMTRRIDKSLQGGAIADAEGLGQAIAAAGS